MGLELKCETICILGVLDWNVFICCVLFSQGHKLLSWTGLILLYRSWLYFRGLDVTYVYFSIVTRAIPWDTMRAPLNTVWNEALRDGCKILPSRAD